MSTIDRPSEHDGTARCTRRSFLGGTAAFALASYSSAAGHVVPHRARYRLAVAGPLDRQNCEISPADERLCACGIEMVAVSGAGTDPTGESAQQEMPMPAFSHYRRMLEAVKPDLLWIGATAAEDRWAMALTAARHGVRGICIKPPLYKMLRDVDEMAAECRSYGAKLMVFHPLRYGRQLPLVGSVLATGGLGRIREIRVGGTFEGDCSEQRLWRSAEELLALIHQLGGEPRSCLGRAYIAGRSARDPSSLCRADTFHATYAVSGAVMAHLDLVRRSKGDRGPGIKISGSRGVLELETAPLPAVRLLAEPSWSRGGPHRLAVPLADAHPMPEFEEGPAHVWALRDLIASIEEDREPTGSVAAARAAAEMLTAAIQSQRRGRSIPLQLGRA